MEKKIKNKILDLDSKNEYVCNLITNLKTNPKVYVKLLSALQILGVFDGKTEVDIYDIIDKNDEKKIRLWCKDTNDNLFIFYALSSEKSDLLKITKETNEEVFDYDIMLAKKYQITSDNINLTRIGNVINFKFGRLITNKINLYSLFMSEDLVYQIVGDLNKELSKLILNKVNKLDKIPSLSEYIKIFEEILIEEDCNFTKLKISAFKQGQKIGNISIGETKILERENVLRKSK